MTTRFHRPAIRSLCLALTTLAAATGASAKSSCGTLSPSLQTLGADYLLLEEDATTVSASHAPPTPARAAIDGSDRATTARLAHLLEALRTAPLDGIDGERVRCRGAGGTAREIVWRFDLDQLERVERANGSTVLTAFEARHTVQVQAPGRAVGDDRLVDGLLVAEVVDVPPTEAWRANADGTALRANRRFRRAGASAWCALALHPVLPNEPLSTDGNALDAGRCSLLTEIDTTARVVGGAIEIEQVRYVDGRWSERVLWRLDS